MNERPIRDFLGTLDNVIKECRIEQASASIYQEKLMLERQMKCLEMIRDLAIAVLWHGRLDETGRPEDRQDE